MLAMILVVLVALLHFYFLVLEMFLWEQPRTRVIFGMDAELSAKTKVLAGNQGLYNGFLAAGLIWGLWLGEARIQLFFLICVLVAGIYGGLTASRKILIVQAVPAICAIVAVWLA